MQREWFRDFQNQFDSRGHIFPIYYADFMAGPVIFNQGEYQ